MKYFASLLIGSAVAVLTSCSSPNDPSPLSTDSGAYFFQQDQTLVYTYLVDNLSTTQTNDYEVTPVDARSTDTFFQLQKKDSTVLYYFKSERSLDGTTLCLLANVSGDKGFVALKGNMDLGATWFADASKNVEATVVGKYAEYYLPGRQIHYTDVVVVKYTDNTAPTGDYIVRYFARNYGLVFEKKISGSSSIDSDLQLISRQTTTSSVNANNHHDRWYNNRRYTVNMMTDDLLHK